MFPGWSSSCTPSPSAKGRMGWCRTVGVAVGTRALPLSQARGTLGFWEVVIPESPHRAGEFGEETPVSGCKFLCEHQLSTQVINPFWDRFRFYCSGWGSSQTSVALRNGSAGPWQLTQLGWGRDREGCTLQGLPPLPCLPNRFSQSWQRKFAHE